MAIIIPNTLQSVLPAPTQLMNPTKIDRIKNIFINIYQHPTLSFIGAGLGVVLGSIASLSIPAAFLLGFGSGSIASSVNQAFFRIQLEMEKDSSPQAFQALEGTEIEKDSSPQAFQALEGTEIEKDSSPQAFQALEGTEIEKGSRLQAFQALKDRMREKKNPSIYVTNPEGLQKEMLLGVLGRGGCKRAMRLEGDRALILPNMDVEVEFFAKKWERIVDEEVAMSQLLTEIGLLSPLSQKVGVSLSADSHEETIPAYQSETFESLGKTKGWFIIDTKNSASSNWEEGENFLFASEEDRLSEKNWDLISASLLDDVAKICIYDIPIPIDSLNVAIVKQPSKLEISRYEIRYFGFDFSSKRGALSIPKIQERLFKEPDMGKAKGVLSFILDQAFFFEFGTRYDEGSESKKLRDLKDSLVEKYSKEIAIRVNELLTLEKNKIVKILV